MNKQHLRDLIFQGRTQRTYPFLTSTITFQTLYDAEIVQQDVVPLLSQSIALVGQRSVEPAEVKEWLLSQSRVTFNLLLKQYSRFSLWLNEDPQSVVISVIREIAEESISRYRWKQHKALQFQEWQNKWTWYRKIWMGVNIALDEKEQFDLVEYMGSLVNPEMMKQIYQHREFEKATGVSGKALDLEQEAARVRYSEATGKTKEQEPRVVEILSRLHSKRQSQVDELEVVELEETPRG